jgi:uncharacterized protein YaeQ
MAPNATVYKLELQVSDMDRHYYASHNLTLAQHPSETDLRLMARLIAFALFAEERLEFGRGLSNDEDPDIWLRDYTSEIELWIDLGQPDESRIKKACGRARQAVVFGYLTVISISSEELEAATEFLQRGMRLTAMIQDGELQLMSDNLTVAIRPTIHMAPVSA